MFRLIFTVYLVFYQIIYVFCATRCPRVMIDVKRGFCPYPMPEVSTTGVEAILCSADKNCPGNLKCCPILQRRSGKIYYICTVPNAILASATQTEQGFMTETISVTVTETVTVTLATILPVSTADLWNENTHVKNTRV